MTLEIFSWDRMGEELKNTQRTRDIIIRKAFEQWSAGHDYDDTLSSPEMATLFQVFKAGYITSELIAE